MIKSIRYKLKTRNYPCLLQSLDPLGIFYLDTLLLSKGEIALSQQDLQRKVLFQPRVTRTKLSLSCATIFLSQTIHSKVSLITFTSNWSGRRESNPRIPSWQDGSVPLRNARIIILHFNNKILFRTL